MPDPQQQTTPTSVPAPDGGIDLSGLRVRTVGGIDLSGLRFRTTQQAKSELPQPTITPPWQEEPQLESAPTSNLGKAFQDGKQLLEKYGQHFSEKVLAPFREGLDRIGDQLQQAGESGHTQSGGRLTDPTRALVSGAGTLLKQVPVGRNVKETIQMSLAPPEFGPEGKALSKELKAAQKTESAIDLSGLRTRAVPKTEVPQKSPFRIAAETPDKVSDFHSAVQNTEGAELSDSRLTLDVVRHQKPEQAGERAIRTGVFFLPEKKSPYQRYYTTGRQGYGGTQRIEGRTTFENPIIAKGASGGKVPERAYDAINGEGAYDEMRQDVLDATTHGWNQRSHGELVQNVADVLENHGGNPDLAEDIVRNSKEGNTLAYAVQEHIVASSVRKAGHDGIVGFSKIKGQPRLSEVFDLRRDKYPISSQLFESKTATPDLSVPSDAPKTITVYRGGEPGKPGKYGSTFYAENPEYAGNFSADQNRTLLNKTITPKNPLDLNKPADALTVAKAMVKAEGTKEAPEEFAKSIVKEGGVSYIHPKAAADLKSQGYDYLTSAHDYGSAGTSGRVWLELGESKPAIDLSGLRVRPVGPGRQPAQWTAFLASGGKKYRYPADVTWEQILSADPGAKKIK